MNWYRQAKFDWKRFTKTVGLTTGIGGSALGIGSLFDSQPTKNPNPIENQSIVAPQVVSPQEAKAVPDKKPNATKGDIASILIPQLRRFEGVRPRVYKDSEGIPTVGVGFNLEKPNARILLRSVGADYRSILNGSQSLSNEQIDRLLYLDIQDAIKTAKTIVKTFDSQPVEVQVIIVDMAFNLGNRLSEFRKMIQAVNNFDYNTASVEMLNSQWATQVKGRAVELSNRMKQIEKGQVFEY